MTYNRPWKSYTEQLALLKSRGLTISDDAAALSQLERIGYYRLSAYWYPFRVFQVSLDPVTNKLKQTRTDQFAPHTQLLDAVNLYLFDKKLRLLVQDALERIEIALRVDIAYLLSEQDAFAHLHAVNLHPTFSTKTQKPSGKSSHAEWVEKYQQLVHRSKEDFVRHHKAHHDGKMPIWVAIEVWDFGLMSKMFAMMKVHDQEKISRKYGVPDWQAFQSWLRSLNYLRNLAAHHSRLWNRNVIDQPKLPAKGSINWCDDFAGKAELIAKPFLLLAICRHLTLRICPGTQWHNRVKALLLTFPAQFADQKRSIQDIGVTEEWETWW